MGRPRIQRAVEVHSAAEGRDGRTDARTDGCRNLQNGIGAAPEKPASSKSMLACIPKSCSELARKGSNFRVWFGKWFSLKIAIFEGLLSAGIQSPACSQKHSPCCSRGWWRGEEKCLSGSREPWTSRCRRENNSWERVLLPFHVPSCFWQVSALTLLAWWTRLDGNSAHPPQGFTVLEGRSRHVYLEMGLLGRQSFETGKPTLSC